LRKEAGASEQVFWSFIRKERLGFRFRRQFPVDRFVLDFYCHEARLAVEVDGEVHAQHEARDRDRDRILSDLGVRVVRLASMVLFDSARSAELSAHLASIQRLCIERSGRDPGPAYHVRLGLFEPSPPSGRRGQGEEGATLPLTDTSPSIPSPWEEADSETDSAGQAYGSGGDRRLGASRRGQGEEGALADSRLVAPSIPNPSSPGEEGDPIANAVESGTPSILSPSSLEEEGDSIANAVESGTPSIPNPSSPREEGDSDPVAAERNLAAIIVLAAGLSRRFGSRNKLLIDWDDEVLIRRVVQTGIDALGGQVIVVTGHEASDVEAAIAGLDVRIADNPRYTEGMGSSIAAGVRAAPANATGFLIVPGDMPRLTSRTLRSLIDSRAAIAICRAAWGRTAPTYFDARYRSELEALHGDEGARILLWRHAADVVEVAVDDAEVSDID